MLHLFIGLDVSCAVVLDVGDTDDVGVEALFRQRLEYLADLLVFPYSRSPCNGRDNLR